MLALGENQLPDDLMQVQSTANETSILTFLFRDGTKETVDANTVVDGITKCQKENAATLYVKCVLGDGAQYIYDTDCQFWTTINP